MNYIKMKFLILTLMTSLFIPITAVSTLDNQTTDDSFGVDLENTSPNLKSFAIFTVKTQKSDECLSSPLCKVITERDLKESVFIFYSNKEHTVADNFKGSKKPRSFVFSEEDNQTYWKKEPLLPLQVEAIVMPPDQANSKKSIIEKLSFEYNEDCSADLYIGGRADCTITIYPDYSEGTFSSIR